MRASQIFERAEGVIFRLSTPGFTEQNSSNVNTLREKSIIIKTSPSGVYLEDIPCCRRELNVVGVSEIGDVQKRDTSSGIELKNRMTNSR